MDAVTTPADEMLLWDSRGTFTRDELDALQTMHDWRSWFSLLLDWGMIFASFALVAVWPNPVTILVALAVIGARQLGLAVLMHEAAHRTAFRSRSLNEIAIWVGSLFRISFEP